MAGHCFNSDEQGNAVSNWLRNSPGKASAFLRYKFVLYSKRCILKRFLWKIWFYSLLIRICG